jgi:hypothetical protein
LSHVNQSYALDLKPPLGSQNAAGYAGPMRTKLRIAAFFLALVVTAYWFFGGPNLGWTMNSVPHKEIEPVTGREWTRYEDRFVPGLDFLGAGLFVAALVGGSSFLIRKKTKTGSTDN